MVVAPSIDNTFGLRKKPGHKIHGADGHTHAENDAGQGTLGLAFAEGEHQPPDHNRDQAEALGDWAGKGRL